MSVGPLVTESDLAEMVEQVWASYLDPEGLSPLIPTGDEMQPSDVHSSVSISGAWTGHLVYASSAVGARRAAAAFLSMPLAEVTPVFKRDWVIEVETLQRLLVGPGLRRSLQITMGAVAAVLLLACANVTNLLLARGASRHKEMVLNQVLMSRDEFLKEQV